MRLMKRLMSRERIREAQERAFTCSLLAKEMRNEATKYLAHQNFAMASFLIDIADKHTRRSRKITKVIWKTTSH